MRCSLSVLAAAAVAAVFLAGCSNAPATTVAPVTTATSRTTSVPTTVTTSPTPPSTTTPAPETPWSTRSIASIPFSSPPVVPAGSDTAFALVSTGNAPSSPQLLTSVGLRSGIVRSGPQVPGGSFLVTTGNRLYLVGPAALESNGEPQALFRLRAVSLPTMGLGPAVPLGALGANGDAYSGSISFQPTGPSAGDLWVGASGRLELIDPATGVVLMRTLPPAAEGYGVATEPDGRFVDVSVLTQQPSVAGEVLEIDTATGAVVDRLTKIFAIGAPALTAVPGGLWISYRGCMLGTSEHVVEPSLAIDTPFTAASGSTRPVPGQSVGMGEGATLVGDVVLLSDIFGVACLSAAGTRPLASAVFPGGSWSSAGRSWGAFAASGSTVYAVGTTSENGRDESIISVTLPAAC
jgi:hypothetical protein